MSSFGDSLKRKIKFETIYKNNVWTCNGVRSGHGSELNQTINIRNFLDKFIPDNSIKSVVDLGCGDLNWIKHTQAFSIDYTGIDIAGPLIEEHKSNYTDKKFYNKDIIKDEIPECDLIIIHDVIFHIKIRDILFLFENIKHKFKYLLITSCNNIINEDNHENIYHFSKVNLEITPFNKIKGVMAADESHSNRKVLLFTHENFY
jgi:hypothetical protein